MSDDDDATDAARAALTRVLAGERADVVVPRALAALPDNAARARFARRVTGASILRFRLAHLGGADSADAILDAYVRFHERAEPVTAVWPADARARLVVERSCPRPLVDALVDSLGLDGADAFLAASNVPGPKVLRANTLRCTRAQLAARILAEDGITTVDGAVAPAALVVSPREQHANLFGAAAWRDGWFEVQDEASQLVAVLCAPKPGDVVVDLCAGRGGKTLALAAAMNDTGILYVHDVDKAALKDMTPRLARAGVTCVRRGLSAPYRADVVLVDAPCSSLGVLRRSPDLRFTFDVAAVPALAAEQRELLAHAATLVRPGGRVVYATCSVLADENERVVAASGLATVSTRNLGPHVDGADGFFIAVLAA